MTQKYTSAPVNRASAYHTDTDCPRLRDLHEVSDTAVEWHGLTECEWCADVVDFTGEHGEQQPKQYVGLDNDA